ncbi:hypothetical protein [Chryseobacterium polytrichastri]|uniref:EpsG family protein n=1 Tax=Chryseobacterium polytrichastri TaxID=1302687 RepID=A0A1M6X7F7_9FLAO|nr:hypothetical protein [Chryseobacterium polytrichastri]SHL01942.1 hypothetical protein SAMN05444267_1010115 [Chryseobacterium polytrichastri]
MKTKVINYIISLILVVYYYISITTTYSLIVINKGGWYLGEWLINYQDGGFKRRGFFGSLFIFINEVTKINLENIIFSFLFLVYTLFFYLLIKLFWKEKNNLLVIALILLPAGFGMMVKEPSIASKKEIIFFLFYLIYILCIRSKIIIRDFVISLFIIVAILTHEAAFFYLPFVSFTYFLNNKGSSLDKIKKVFIYQLLPSTIIMAFLFKFGINISTGNSVLFLKNHGLVLQELGIYEYDPNYNVLDIYKASIYSYQTYIISIFLGAFTFYIYCKLNAVKINLLFLSLQTIFLIPLFYLAVDWGRWVNIFFSLLTIFIVTEQKLVLTRKQEIITVILILFNSSWTMLLKTTGFITFPFLDDFLKQVYYFVYFKIQKIFI